MVICHVTTEVFKIRLSFEETLGHMKTLLLLYSCLCETPQEITQAHDNSTLKRI